MRVFLDTNVLVSAVATRGLCADVLREVLISHHLILSAHLLVELEGDFRKKLSLPENLISEFLKMIQQDALFSTPSAKPDVNLQDKGDLPILSSALSGGADLFVTGDIGLLELRKIGNMVEIVSPRGFWQKLKAGS